MRVVIILSIPEINIIKLKLSLCLIKHYILKVYRVVGVWMYSCITNALVGGGEWSALCLINYAPEERISGTGY
jgi:hypothetical protein